MLAAPLDGGCALDEVALAVVEAEVTDTDVELDTNDDREALAVPAPDELGETLLQPCKQGLSIDNSHFPKAGTYQGIKCCPVCSSY